MSNSTRIFSFGLGRSPSRALVKGLARATNGRFVFIPPKESVDIYVGEQLEKALQSSIANIQIKWNLRQNMINVPTKIPPVYVNDRLIVYALANDATQSNPFDHNSSVELFNDKHRLGEAKVNRIPSVSDNGTIARLAAKALILELQHSKISSSNKKSGSRQARFEKQVQEETRKRIIELSLKYNILSSYTAFIGIEKRINSNNDNMELRDVPIQISPDDQHLQTSQLIKYHGVSMNSQALKTKRCRNKLAKPRAKKACCPKKSSYHKAAAWLLNDRMVINHSVPPEKQFKQESLPSDDQNTVRYLINEQTFDGFWHIDSKNIEQLIGKPLSHFQH